MIGRWIFGFNDPCLVLLRAFEISLVVVLIIAFQFRFDHFAARFD
jgi:hypothetical protein